MTDRTVTTEDAAAELDVPPDLISKWKHRGDVVPAGYIPGRARGGLVPLYRLDELRPLAARYHARHTARHADRDTSP